MAEAPDRFALRIERSMAGMAALGDWVDAIAAALQLDAKAEYALRLCLEEAATNIVMHGQASSADDAAAVALRVDATADTVVLTVEDRCAAFDPLGVPPPAPLASLQDARIGGLGVHLLRQYAQALRYERAGEVNRLTISLSRSALRPSVPERPHEQ